MCTFIYVERLDSDYTVVRRSCNLRVIQVETLERDKHDNVLFFFSAPFSSNSIGRAYKPAPFGVIRLTNEKNIGCVSMCIIWGKKTELRK